MVPLSRRRWPRGPAPAAKRRDVRCPRIEAVAWVYGVEDGSGFGPLPAAWPLPACQPTLWRPDRLHQALHEGPLAPAASR